MKSGCFVSAACACINKEMFKVIMEGAVNAAMRPQDAGEVRRKRVGGSAEVMCPLSRERVDTCVLHCLKLLVLRSVREHGGRTALLRGEINVFSVAGSVNYALSKSMRVFTAHCRHCMPAESGTVCVR